MEILESKKFLIIILLILIVFSGCSNQMNSLNNNNINNDSSTTDLKHPEQEVKKQTEKELQNELNPLIITNKLGEEDGGYYYCTGSIKNVSKSTKYYVKIRVSLYDANKNIITSDWGYAVGSEGIRSEENHEFEIITKVNSEVSFYSVEIYDYD